MFIRENKISMSNCRILFFLKRVRKEIFQIVRSRCVNILSIEVRMRVPIFPQQKWKDYRFILQSIFAIGCDIMNYSFKFN